MLSPIPLPHGGRGERGKKNKNIIITSPIQSYSIFVHCLTQSPHLSPFTLHPRHRPPRIVSTCLSDCPRAGLLLPPPSATPGIASLPLPGWASPWSPTALSMMSLLRQAKIYWVDSEEGAVSRFTKFHHFCFWNVIAGGFTSHWLFAMYFLWNTQLKANQPHDVYILHLPWLAHWLRHRCYLAVSPKPSFSLCCLLWHRGCLYDITGALFAEVLSPFCVDGFAPLCGFVANRCFHWPFACFCTIVKNWHFT